MSIGFKPGSNKFKKAGYKPNSVLSAIVYQQRRIAFIGNYNKYYDHLSSLTIASKVMLFINYTRWGLPYYNVTIITCELLPHSFHPCPIGAVYVSVALSLTLSKR